MELNPDKRDRAAKNMSALENYDQPKAPTRFRASRYKFDIPWAVQSYAGGGNVLPDNIDVNQPLEMTPVNTAEHMKAAGIKWKKLPAIIDARVKAGRVVDTKKLQSKGMTASLIPA